jgi:cobalt-zinc-cadmium efflux system outer membrane protein
VQQRVLTDVRIAFYDVLIAQRQVDLARDMVRISEQAFQTSQDLWNAQEVSRVALLQTEIQSQDAQILLRKAENEIEGSWRRLNSVIGRPEFVPQPLAGDVEDGVIEITWDGALQRLLRDSPEIAAASAELQRARWTLRRACAEVTPNVNVQMAVHHDAPTDDVVTRLQVGVPVPILNRNQGAIRQARAEIAAAERNIERLDLGLRERMAHTFQQYANARFEVQKYSGEILPKAKQTLDLVTRGYRQGEVGYLDQLTAQRTYFQTNISYIDALRELWRGTISIEGLLLQGSLLDTSAK